MEMWKIPSHYHILISWKYVPFSDIPRSCLWVPTNYPLKKRGKYPQLLGIVVFIPRFPTLPTEKMIVVNKIRQIPG